MRITLLFKKLVFLLFWLTVVPFGLRAQSNITTVGIQFKPIISAEFLNTGPQTETLGDINFTIAPANGFAFGMIVRKGFNDQFSLETGINYSRRNYDLSIGEDSTGFLGRSDFSYVIYEIPVLALIYVRLGENSYLNNAFGINLNFLPSDWQSFDNYFEHYSSRTYWVMPALQANIGFEYRTRESGFYYVGFSFHQPFQNITTAAVLYKDPNSREVKEITAFDITGNYLTLDLRYFFHEPAKRQRR
jgi:hypothetical protein